MIHSGKGYAYPGTLIYAAAAYAFYSLTSAIVSLVRLRKFGSPAVSAAKMVSLWLYKKAVFTSCKKACPRIYQASQVGPRLSVD